jgi:hypothetical protein
MNIFVLDLDPAKAAAAHCDKHVTKMCLEYAQLLCTAAHVLGVGDDKLYRKTHVNHPCAVWTRAAEANIWWLAQLLWELGAEHERRYGTTHKSVDVGVTATANLLRVKYHDRNQTPFALAMPDQYKNKNVVKAYRAYYLGEKQAIARWAHGATPRWWKRS